MKKNKKSQAIVPLTSLEILPEGMLANLTGETSLVLRVCSPDMASSHGFQWPSEIGAVVRAPDWIATPQCGNGLHGWLYGQGDLFCVDYWRNEHAKWLVLEVPSEEIIVWEGKCKFPRARVRFIGNKEAAAAFIIANEPRAEPEKVIGARITAGDLGTATAGDLGTATAGDLGTATVGKGGRIIFRDQPTYSYFANKNGVKENTPYCFDANGKLSEI